MGQYRTGDTKDKIILQERDRLIIGATCVIMQVLVLAFVLFCFYIEDKQTLNSTIDISELIKE